ncbi:MAG: transglutaminase family protein, partial [Caulobacterales bacterium]
MVARIEQGAAQRGALGAGVVLRLAGDLFTYEDPGNADIISVTERRKGLAVALGVFYIHASRKCGLTV